VILAAGTPQILLPWDNATVFKRNFSEYSEGKYASWTAWAAPATMSVGEAARRVGMPESDLRSANSIPPRMLIKAGSVLIVPRKSATQADVGSHVADHGQLSLAPEIATRRTVVKAARKDSVVAIARRYKVSPEQVAEWNNLGTASVLKAGQQVVLHLPVRAARSPIRATSHAPMRASARAGARGPVKPAPRKPVIQQKKRG